MGVFSNNFYTPPLSRGNGTVTCASALNPAPGFNPVIQPPSRPRRKETAVNMTWDEAVRQQLISEINKTGLAARVIAQRTGISQAQLSAYLLGKSRLGPERLGRLAAYCGLELALRPLIRPLELPEFEGDE